MRNYHRGTNQHDTHHEMAVGNTPLRSTWSAWGSATLTTAGTIYPLWPASTSSPIFQTSPANVTVSSTSANDNFTTGSGARVVQITGTTSIGQIESEYINLNGTSVAVSTKLYFNVSEAKVVTTGSSPVNAGDITLRNVVSTDILAFIPTAAGRNNGCLYQPAMETPYTITRLVVSAFNSTTTTPINFVRISGVTYGYQNVSVRVRNSYFEARPASTAVFEFGGGILIPRNTMVFVEATGATNGSTCAAWMTGVAGTAR